MTKKFLSILFVIILCFSSLGATVSDNDGSAFITKAEFDSLKSNFQAQINKYQSNIDSKIDSAIASYLAGVKVANKTQINFKLSQKMWNSINNETFTERHIGTIFCDTFTLSTVNNRTGTYTGVQGYFYGDQTSQGAQGIMLDTLDTDKENGKIGIIKGVGLRYDNFAGYRNDFVNNTSTFTASNLINLYNSFQVNWWTGTISRSTELPTEYTYYNTCAEEDSAAGWGPISFGAYSGNTSLTLMSNTKPTLKHYSVKVDMYNNNLWLVNDEIVTTCIDNKRINGLALIPQTEKYAKYISSLYKFKLRGTFYAGYNYSNSVYNTTNSTNVVKSLLDAGWSGTANYLAYISSSDINRATSDTGWNSGSGNSHKGYDRLLYISHIENPTKLLTDKLIYDEDFVDWLKKKAPADAYGTYKINDKTNTYYNIRYGIPIIHEDDKNVKYELSLINRTKNAIDVKVFNKLTTTNFNNVEGLETNKSDKNRKNAVRVATGSDIKFEFEVKNDNSPIFLKCSDNANITLSSLYKSIVS